MPVPAFETQSCRQEQRTVGRRRINPPNAPGGEVRTASVAACRSPEWHEEKPPARGRSTTNPLPSVDSHPEPGGPHPRNLPQEIARRLDRALKLHIRALRDYRSGTALHQNRLRGMRTDQCLIKSLHSFHSWPPSGMAGAGWGWLSSTVDHSVIRGLVTASLHFVTEQPLSNVAAGLALQPVSQSVAEGSPHRPSAPRTRHANSGLSVLYLGSGTQPTARQPWVWPDTSQAMAQMKLTSSRATAVVTWHFGLPARNR